LADALSIDALLVIPGEELEVTAARSGGPGGQHVNTAETRVRLRFALSATTALRPDVIARLRDQNRAWLTDEGDLVLTSDVHRSRARNLDEGRPRLAAAIRKALVRPKPRRPTKPTRSSKHRRIQDKKKRGDVKSTRGKVRDDV
jgi:ribosome-associated protein